MNYKLVIAAIALPIGFTSFLPKSVSATEIAPKLETKLSSIVVAQRSDRDLWEQRNDRREQIRRKEAQRNQEYRGRYTRRVWIPGHHESGFLGIGRKWVAGHWEDRR